MIFFKACPRCHGDLYLDSDMYGVYVKCLQCAFVKDSTIDTQAREETAARTLTR